MNTIKSQAKILAFTSVFAVLSNSAFADEISYPNNGFLQGYSLSAYENEYSWRHNAGDYTVPVDAPTLVEVDSGISHELINPDDDLVLQVSEDKDAKEFEEEEFVDKILSKIPYSKTLKSTWNVIDGDVDLYVEGLRVDRGNKGVTYKTNTIPFMGEVDGVQFKASAGEDNKLSFESSVVPFVGHVEGLKFKSSVGDDDSQVSLRYNISLDRLGL